MKRVSLYPHCCLSGEKNCRNATSPISLQSRLIWKLSSESRLLLNCNIFAATGILEAVKVLGCKRQNRQSLFPSSKNSFKTAFKKVSCRIQSLSVPHASVDSLMIMLISRERKKHILLGVFIYWAFLSNSCEKTKKFVVLLDKIRPLHWSEEQWSSLVFSEPCGSVCHR